MKKTVHIGVPFVRKIPQGAVFLFINICNPVFIDIGQRVGTENFYQYFHQFGLMSKTGVDLPGEPEATE